MSAPRRAKKRNVAPLVAEPRSEIAIRLPMPPAVVAALEEHAGNAQRLAALVRSWNGRPTADPAAVGELVEAIGTAATALRRDVARLRR